MVDIRRREFLKLMGLTGTTALLGCSPEAQRRLIPSIASPEDLIPGHGTWYASTCRECPAGCGLLAKNVDNRVIKLEGNSRHPINGGKLCARGQAALHGLYNPTVSEDHCEGMLKEVLIPSPGERVRSSWCAA